jgi:hypothetical protein
MMCDLFYRMALDIVRPLPKINKGNKYIHVDVDHYFKWCEIKTMPNHMIATTTKFLEEEIIYRYGVPKFIFIDNGGEWFVEFHNLCKVYSIHHQYIASQWFRCNGMVERLVKTIKTCHHYNVHISR